MSKWRRLAKNSSVSLSVAIVVLVGCQAPPASNVNTEGKTALSGNGGSAIQNQAPEQFITDGILPPETAPVDLAPPMKISAEKGGVYVSPDGLLTATIPPGALSQDTEVRFVALDTSKAKNSAQRVAGMRFQMDIGYAYLKPGTRILVSARADARFVPELKSMYTDFTPERYNLKQDDKGNWNIEMPIEGPSLESVPYGFVPEDPLKNSRRGIMTEGMAPIKSKSAANFKRDSRIEAFCDYYPPPPAQDPYTVEAEVRWVSDHKKDSDFLGTLGFDGELATGETGWPDGSARGDDPSKPHVRFGNVGSQNIPTSTHWVTVRPPALAVPQVSHWESVRSESTRDFTTYKTGAYRLSQLSPQVIPPAIVNPPFITGLVRATDTGTNKTDGITTCTAPMFVGTADPGVSVRLFKNGEAVATATTDSYGKWLAKLSTPMTVGTYSFTAETFDSTGATSTLSDPLSITIVSDINTLCQTSPPVVSGLTPETDTGTSTSDGVTSISTPVLVGTADPGSTVQVFQDNRQIGSVSADNSGNWTLPITTALRDGTYRFRADALNGQYSVGGTGTQSISVTIDSNLLKPTRNISKDAYAPLSIETNNGNYSKIKLTNGQWATITRWETVPMTVGTDSWTEVKFYLEGANPIQFENPDWWIVVKRTNGVATEAKWIDVQGSPRYRGVFEEVADSFTGTDNQTLRRGYLHNGTCYCNYVEYLDDIVLFPAARPVRGRSDSKPGYANNLVRNSFTVGIQAQYDYPNPQNNQNNLSNTVVTTVGASNPVAKLKLTKNSPLIQMTMNSPIATFAMGSTLVVETVVDGQTRLYRWPGNGSNTLTADFFVRVKNDDPTSFEVKRAYIENLNLVATQLSLASLEKRTIQRNGVYPLNLAFEAQGAK